MQMASILKNNWQEYKQNFSKKKRKNWKGNKAKNRRNKQLLAIFLKK